MNLVKLNQLSSNEIFRLTKYLEKFATKEEDPKQFVLNHLRNFFPDIVWQEEVLLQNIISENDTEALDNFIQLNPNINVNLDGDSIIKVNPKEGIEVKEVSLVTLYEYLKKLNKLSSHQKQIIKAYELNVLKNINTEKDNYNFLKLKVNSDNKELLLNIKKYESIDIIDIKQFLSKVFKYYLSTHAETFVKYVFHYLDLIRLNPESEIGRKYIKNIEHIL